MKVLFKEDIISVLRQLVVEDKMDIAVHSSLSSLGYVIGGAHTVIQALKEVVTKDGSIYMPDTLVGKGGFAAASAWGKPAKEVKNMFR